MPVTRSIWRLRPCAIRSCTHMLAVAEVGPSLLTAQLASRADAHSTAGAVCAHTLLRCCSIAAQVSVESSMHRAYHLLADLHEHMMPRVEALGHEVLPHRICTASLVSPSWRVS